MVYSLYESGPTGRLSSLSENAGGTQNLVEYTYLGMNTIVKESHPQVAGGLNLSYGSAGTYGGWDRFGQTIGQEWRKDDGTLVDGYGYTYDRAGNRTSKGNLLNSAFSETYAYDGLSRLTDTNRGGVDLQNWSLDALGNWDQFTDQGTTQTRDQNEANETTEITGGWITPGYDAAGNMTTMPKAGAETTSFTAKYDAWNRLVELRDSNNNLVARYEYDGRGFRTRKTLGDGTTFDYYQNDSNQLLEVRKNGSANAYEQYVYDQRYIDAPVMVYRDTNTDGTVDQKLYITQDANFNVTAVVDGATGGVVNRFVYTPNGQRTVLTATWTAGTTDFMLGHQGLYLDGESGLYYNRARYLHPTLGSFIQRDPLGYVDGASLYQYELDSPTDSRDSNGTDEEHTKNKNPSNLPKHEKGQARKVLDKQGEKGDINRGRFTPRGGKATNKRGMARIPVLKYLVLLACEAACSAFYTTSVAEADKRLQDSIEATQQSITGGLPLAEAQKMIDVAVTVHKYTVLEAATTYAACALTCLCPF